FHSTAVGIAKPDVAFFDAARAVLRTRADETLHVGDGVAEDVEGARAAGCHAVLLDRSGQRPRATPVSTIVTLTQVPTLVAALGCNASVTWLAHPLCFLRHPLVAPHASLCLTHHLPCPPASAKNGHRCVEISSADASGAPFRKAPLCRHGACCCARW